MKKRYAFINLLLVCAVTTNAMDFGVKNVDQSKVNKKKWQCEYCTKQQEWSGDWAIIGQYIQDDEAVFNNIVDHDDGVSIDANVRAHYRKSDRYAKLWYNGADGNAEEPGFNTGAKLVYYSGAQYSVDYQELPRMYGDSGQTPFSQSSSANLTLPSDWQTNPSSQLMPGLSSALNPIKLELSRDTLTLAFQYRGDSPWRSHISVAQEKKEGRTLGSGFNRSKVTFLPLPVDYITTNVNTGVSLLLENWLADFSYQYLDFENDQSTLNWQDPFTLATQSTALSPDNQLHKMALKLRFTQPGTQVLLSGHYSQSLQDESFVGSTMPVNALDGRRDEADFRFKISHRLPWNVRLSAKYSFNERNNKTDKIVIGDRVTRVNNYRNQSFDLTAQIKSFDSFNLKLAAKFTTKDRPEQERTRIDDNSIKVTITEKTLENADLNLSYFFSQRDGSSFTQGQQSRNIQHQALRRFNLANRERHEIKSTFGYNISPLLSMELNGFYAKDEYDDTEIGLRQGKDSGFDLSLSNSFQSYHWYVFYSKEYVRYEQSGSDNLAATNWWGDTDNDTEQYGFSLEFPSLIENLLTLGVDYHYSKGEVSQSITQARSEDYSSYPDNDYKMHHVDLQLTYAMAEKTELIAHFIYERSDDADYFNYNADVDTLPTIVSSGIIADNYHNTYIGLSYKQYF